MQAAEKRIERKKRRRRRRRRRRRKKRVWMGIERRPRCYRSRMQQLRCRRRMRRRRRRRRRRKKKGKRRRYPLGNNEASFVSRPVRRWRR
jgi:hypothetical protein